MNKFRTRTESIAINLLEDYAGDVPAIEDRLLEILDGNRFLTRTVGRDIARLTRPRKRRKVEVKRVRKEELTLAQRDRQAEYRKAA